MNIKKIGGILMITGNAIGGGMLALPLATSSSGFFYSSGYLFICWLIMLAGGLLILEINLCFPPNTHLIGMARATLGSFGAVITWLCYLLLFYSLLAAYTAGGADFLSGLMQNFHLDFSERFMAAVFSISLSMVIWKGIKSVDLLNRLLMGGKLLVYFFLIILLFPFISSHHLHQGQFFLFPKSLTIMITSFGFAAIIPSLRSYFHSDVKQLRQVIIIGSLIPLLCYLLWNAVVMGIIPLQGVHSLSHIAHSPQPNTQLINQLSLFIHNKIITSLAWGFTSVCLATSFLGVGLSLTDFLFDGLKRAQTPKNKAMIFPLTFIPPLFIVLFFPAIFISALSYAGIYCVILLALLPALMAWSGRYRLQLNNFSYRVKGGKLFLSLVIVAASIIIIHALIDIF